MADGTTVGGRGAGFLGYSHQRARDLYASFGYSREPTLQELYQIYERNDIANRIVRAFPQATWREHPVIRDEAGSSSEKGENYSAFTESAEACFRRHGLFSYLERADRLSSLGRYGVLLLGFADGKPMSEPIEGKAKLLYVAPYAEVNCTINQFELDETNPRFGRPKAYTLSRQTMLVAGGTSTSVPGKQLNVHHSRVLHLAEMLEQDEVYGMPRLLPIFNRLKDLEKVVGGSAEMFWLSASRILMFKADADANLTPEEIQSVKDQADELQHQLRRYILAAGISAEAIAPDNVDPKPNVDTLLDLISGASGIPKRILIGSERGELSSAQDENNWTKRVGERRKNYCEPFMLRPLTQKLIDTGNIIAPKGAFWGEWKDGDELTPQDQANIGATTATAISTYVNTPGAELVVPVAEFREQILGLPPESEYEVQDAPETIEELPEGEEPLVEAPADGDPAIAPPGEGETVQDTALNGAQISSLVQIITAVTDGQMPIETAIQVILVSFPGISEQKARQIVAPLASFEPKVEAPAAPRFEKEEKEPATNAGLNPRTLYVSRRVLNWDSIARWAKGQGFGQIDRDLHVTLCHSKKPVKWEDAQEDRDEDNLLVEPDRDRAMAALGEDGKAAVLLFNNDGIEWRHKQLRGIGASHDYPSYKPHITITYAAGNVDLGKVRPYDGAIVLGPEVFAEVKPD